MKEPRMVNMLIRKHLIDKKEHSAEAAKIWTFNVKEVMKNAEKLKKNNIRRYFEY